MTRRAVSALGCTSLLLALACGETEGQPSGERPPVRVQVVTVTAQTLPRTLSSVGSFESPLMTTVSSEIESRVIALDIPEGTRVDAGRVLARLDDAEPQAALRVAQARRTNAIERLKRLEGLRAKNAASAQSLDDAQAERDAATASFDEAKTRLEKTSIEAPFTGVLGLRQVNVGQYVDAGDPIVELTQVDPVELLFSVPQRHAGAVSVGQVVQGRIGTCGIRFDGVVTAIDPRVDRGTRSIRLQASVPNAAGALHPGMAASVQLFVGETPNAIVVPQEAIVRQGTKHVIYIVDADGAAEQRTVTLGQFFVDGVHVVDGVSGGEVVVAAGQQKLRPGTPVDVSDFEPVDNANLELGRRDPDDDCGPET